MYCDVTYHRRVDAFSGIEYIEASDIRLLSNFPTEIGPEIPEALTFAPDRHLQMLRQKRIPSIVDNSPSGELT